MNIEVENLPNCQVSLRIQLPAERVAERREEICSRYQRLARLPGYRPGKAPKSVVAKKFQDEIIDELKRDLVESSFQEAVREKNIRALSLTEVDEVRLDAESGLSFHARAIIQPEFELPNYRGISVSLPGTTVTDEEVEHEIGQLLRRFSSTQAITHRPAAPGDYVALEFTGTIDGQPVSATAPDATQLDKAEDAWFRVNGREDDHFYNVVFPDFTPVLNGAKAGDTFEIDLPVPETTNDPALKDKTIHFHITVNDIYEEQLSEFDENFCQQLMQFPSVEACRDFIRQQLLDAKSIARQRTFRQQITQFLHQNIQCELPPSYVYQEAQRVIEEIVADQESRGADTESIKSNEEAIVNTANAAAATRVKTAFILMRIAEAEKITVSKEEFTNYLAALAVRTKMSPEKLMKQIQRRNAFGTLQEDLLIAKTLEFLESQASVQEMEPTTPGDGPQSDAPTGAIDSTNP